MYIVASWVTSSRWSYRFWLYSFARETPRSSRRTLRPPPAERPLLHRPAARRPARCTHLRGRERCGGFDAFLFREKRLKRLCEMEDPNDPECLNTEFDRSCLILSQFVPVSPSHRRRARRRTAPGGWKARIGRTDGLTNDAKDDQGPSIRILGQPMTHGNAGVGPEPLKTKPNVCGHQAPHAWSRNSRCFLGTPN